MNTYTGSEIGLIKQLNDAKIFNKLYEDALMASVVECMDGKIELEDGKAELAIHKRAEGRIVQLLNSLVGTDSGS